MRRLFVYVIALACVGVYAAEPELNTGATAVKNDDARGWWPFGVAIPSIASVKLTGVRASDDAVGAPMEPPAPARKAKYVRQAERDVDYDEEDHPDDGDYDEDDDYDDVYDTSRGSEFGGRDSMSDRRYRRPSNSARYRVRETLKKGAAKIKSKLKFTGTAEPVTKPRAGAGVVDTLTSLAGHSFLSQLQFFGVAAIVLSLVIYVTVKMLVTINAWAFDFVTFVPKFLLCHFGLWCFRESWNRLHLPDVSSYVFSMLLWFARREAGV